MYRTACTTLLLFASCRSMSNVSEGPPEPNDRMREACPSLTDEVIAGFIFAISELQDDVPDQTQATESWVQSCDEIPPDGNFQGDKEACAACLPVIVDEVYD